MATHYYEYKQPEPPLKSQGFELVGYEYRGFIIKLGGLYLFYTIQLKGDGILPTELTSNYTSKKLAEDAIDQFLYEERLKKERV